MIDVRWTDRHSGRSKLPERDLKRARIVERSGSDPPLLAGRVIVSFCDLFYMPISWGEISGGVGSMQVDFLTTHITQILGLQSHRWSGTQTPNTAQ